MRTVRETHRLEFLFHVLSGIWQLITMDPWPTGSRVEFHRLVQRGIHWHGTHEYNVLI